MKREFISISGLKKVLSPKELKNIIGGSSCCYVEDSSGTGWCYEQPPTGNGEHWECNTPFSKSFCGC